MNSPKIPQLLLKNTKSEIYQSSNNIKKYLLQFGEFKNIREAKNILGIDNANEVYELLLKGWNEFVFAENKIRMNKYDLEVKKYKDQLKKYNDKQAVKLLEDFNKKAKAVVQQKKEKNQQKVKKVKKSIIPLKTYYKNNVIVVNKDDSFYEIVKKLLGKNLTITIYNEKGGNIVTTRNETIPDNDKEFINWWKSTGVWIIWKNSEETIYNDYPDAVIYIYEADKKINSNKIKQYFKEGNVNCLLKPIFNWAEDCKENSKSATAKSRYNVILKKLTTISNEIGDNGVSETEMIRITNDTHKKWSHFIMTRNTKEVLTFNF